VRALRELAFIMQGLTSAMRALFWSSILLFFVLSFWAIVAVELLHPLIQQLEQEGAFGDCPRCARAYKSVMEANLTWCQTIIAGDSWGQSSIPVIEAYPWTIFVFAGALLSVNMGVMNLILSVIVDVAVQCREDDVNQKLRDKEVNYQKASRELLKMCSQMDADDNGGLSFQEILKGYDHNRSFAKFVNLLDARREDLHCIYSMCDPDGTNSIDYKHFVQGLHNLKVMSSHTAMCLIRQNVKDVLDHVKKIAEDVESIKQPATEQHSKECTRAQLFQFGMCHTESGSAKIHAHSEHSAFEVMDKIEAIRGSLHQMQVRIDDEFAKASQTLGCLCQHSTEVTETECLHPWEEAVANENEPYGNLVIPKCCSRDESDGPHHLVPDQLKWNSHSTKEAVFRSFDPIVPRFYDL